MITNTEQQSTGASLTTTFFSTAGADVKQGAVSAAWDEIVSRDARGKAARKATRASLVEISKVDTSWERRAYVALWIAGLVGIMLAML